MDAAGKVSYSLTPPTTACHARKDKPAARPVATASPADFPRVDPATQRRRDDRRREILQTELESEQQLLAAAEPEMMRIHQRNIEALQKELAHTR